MTSSGFMSSTGLSHNVSSSHQSLTFKTFHFVFWGAGGLHAFVNKHLIYYQILLLSFFFFKLYPDVFITWAQGPYWYLTCSGLYYFKTLLNVISKDSKYINILANYKINQKIKTLA